AETASGPSGVWPDCPGSTVPAPAGGGPEGPAAPLRREGAPAATSLGCAWSDEPGRPSRLLAPPSAACSSGAPSGPAGARAAAVVHATRTLATVGLPAQDTTSMPPARAVAWTVTVHVLGFGAGGALETCTSPTPMLAYVGTQTARSRPQTSKMPTT